jgi:predicted metalloprotease with PDZ domain
MSMQAPFVDAATSIDPHNRDNTFISYYTWGAMIGLNLDLTLRIQHGLTLDDYMRLVWERRGRDEIPYSVEDLQVALGDLVNSPSFAATFFDNFVYGHAVGNYEAMLGRAGLLLRKRNAGVATLGDAQWRFGSTGATLTSGTLVGTPLYEAGLDRGARIESIDGNPLTSEAALTAYLQSKAPGNRATITYDQRGGRGTVTVTLMEDPRMEVVTYEAAGMEVTREIRSFREDWLGSVAATR